MYTTINYCIIINEWLLFPTATSWRLDELLMNGSYFQQLQVGGLDEQWRDDERSGGAASTTERNHQLQLVTVRHGGGKQNQPYR